MAKIIKLISVIFIILITLSIIFVLSYDEYKKSNPVQPTQPAASASKFWKSLDSFYKFLEKYIKYIFLLLISILIFTALAFVNYPSGKNRKFSAGSAALIALSLGLLISFLIPNSEMILTLKPYQISPVSLPDNILDKVQTTLKGFLGFKNPTFLEIWNEFWYYFPRGIVAGFLVWLATGIARLTRWIRITTGLKKEEDEEYKISNIRWMNMVAGRFWKILIIGIFYFVVIQIPVINILARTFTLDYILSPYSFFMKSLVVAIWVGFGPAMYEWYKKTSLSWKYQEKVRKASKVSYLSQAMSDAEAINFKEKSKGFWK